MRVLVDFNAETPDGLFFVRVEQIDAPLSHRQLVQAYDADGDQMMTLVDRIDQERGVVYLRPIWSTWIDGDAAITATSSLPAAPYVSLPGQMTLVIVGTVSGRTQQDARPHEFVTAG